LIDNNTWKIEYCSPRDPISLYLSCQRQMNSLPCLAEVAIFSLADEEIAKYSCVVPSEKDLCEFKLYFPYSYAKMLECNNGIVDANGNARIRAGIRIKRDIQPALASIEKSRDGREVRVQADTLDHIVSFLDHRSAFEMSFVDKYYGQSEVLLRRRQKIKEQVEQVLKSFRFPKGRFAHICPLHKLRICEKSDKRLNTRMIKVIVEELSAEQIEDCLRDTESNALSQSNRELLLTKLSEKWLAHKKKEFNIN